jgi:uncharacterized membrane protein (DUF106 family)
MGPFRMVIIIVCAVLVYKCFVIWIKARSGAIDNNKIAELEKDIAELKNSSEIEYLQKRVGALEEIVIKKEYELEEKFKKL